MTINRYFAKLCTLLVALALLAGCTGPAGEGSLPQPQPGPGVPTVSTAPGTLGIEAVTEANYPRIDGSTANLPLMAELRSRVLGISLEQAETEVSASRTSEAWQRLAWGEVDLLLVYEAPQETKAEIEEMGSAFLEVDAIGLDGLVFLTNVDNPVDGLTRQQLQDIYAGRIRSWNEVGGESAPIAAFQRNADSGSQALFLKLLMGEVAPMDPPTEQVAMGMGALIDSLSAFDGSAAALGYSVFYYASVMYENPQLKFLEVDGVTPTDESLKNGSYPLTNEFYVAIRADEPANSPARALRDWLLTDAGKALMEDAGYLTV